MRIARARGDTGVMEPSAASPAAERPLHRRKLPASGSYRFVAGRCSPLEEEGRALTRLEAECGAIDASAGEKRGGLRRKDGAAARPSVTMRRGAAAGAEREALAAERAARAAREIEAQDAAGSMAEAERVPGKAGDRGPGRFAGFSGSDSEGPWHPSGLTPVIVAHKQL